MACIFWIIVTGIALEKEESAAMDPELAALCAGGDVCDANIQYTDQLNCDATEQEIRLHWVQDFPPLPPFSTPDNLTLNQKWLICVGLGVLTSVLFTEPFIIFLKTCFFVLILPCVKAILYIITCRCYLLFPPQDYEEELNLPDEPELQKKASSFKRTPRRLSLTRQRSTSNIGNQHMYWFFTGELSQHIADEYTPGPPGTMIAPAAGATPGADGEGPRRLSKRMSKAEIDIESHRLANQDFKRMSQIMDAEDFMDDQIIEEARESKNLGKLSALMSKSQAKLLRMEIAD